MSKLVYIGVAGSGMNPYVFEVEEDTDLLQCMLPFYSFSSETVGGILPDGRELERPLGKDVEEDETVWITDHSNRGGGGGVIETIVFYLVSFTSVYQALAIVADQWKQRRVLFWTFPKKHDVKSVFVVMDDGQQIVFDDRKTYEKRLSTFFHAYNSVRSTIKPKQAIFRFHDNTTFVCNVTTKLERDEAKKFLQCFSEEQ